MRSVTLAGVRAHLPRLVASTLAVVIAVAFVVATLVLSQTSRSTVLQAAGTAYVDTAVVVTSEDGSGLLADVGTLTALDGVRAVDPLWETSVQAVVPGRLGQLLATVARLHDEQAGQAVEVLAALGVPDVHAVALDDDGDVVGVVVGPVTGEVHPQVPLAGLLQVVVVVEGHAAIVRPERG